VNFWGEEFRLPRGIPALRLRTLGVYIARRGASADRFVVRVTAAASWERASQLLAARCKRRHGYGHGHGHGHRPTLPQE
jgi:hypothetical protein